MQQLEDRQIIKYRRWLNTISNSKYAESKTTLEWKEMKKTDSVDKSALHLAHDKFKIPFTNLK